RIVGEAHLDFVEVNFNKKGFQTQTPEWKLACEVMREHLKPVVRASQEANRNRSDPNRFVKAVEGMKRARDVGGIAVAPTDGSPDGRQNPETPMPPEVSVQANTLQ